MSKEQLKKNESTDSKNNAQLFGNGKNVLLIMADEFRFPIDKDAGGMTTDLKNILGFQNIDGTSDNAEEYISEDARKLFPGFMKLRENATVLKNHTVATTACVPSRAAMFTGQYGTKNKVTQTDGVFKGASEEGFFWLDPEGIPTLGDWFKQNNYSTHYFGKCHFAHPKKQSLKNWGFDDWETSFPEPHGTLKNNLGMYRDHGFTDLVTTFLRRKGMALDYDQEVGRIEMNERLTEEEKQQQIDTIDKKPWFAVASFTNPHDITTWPVLPAKAQGVLHKPEGIDDDFEVHHKTPLGIPPEGTLSTPPEQGTWRFDMNPGGIDDSYASLPKSWREDLKDKPDCQFDYSLKLGIALASKTGNQKVANNSHKITGIPLPLSEDPKTWTEAYMQYYTYLHHVLDQQIDRVLKTLDESGLREDTIVVFVPDHGEYGGSHGMMMQKWHTAYQEAIHVPVVISMPKEDRSANTTTPKAIEALTSHIDIAPTLLGLTGVTADEVAVLRKGLGGSRVPEFVGADISELITGTATQIYDRFNLEGNNQRNAILFTTSDMITEPIDYKPHKIDSFQEYGNDFDIYSKAVKHYIKTPDDNLTTAQLDDIDRLKRGPVIQPAEVHCIREGSWKLVRYRDYHDPENEKKFQWELYDLDNDSKEVRNLLIYNYTPSEASGQLETIHHENGIDHDNNGSFATQTATLTQTIAVEDNQNSSRFKANPDIMGYTDIEGRRIERKAEQLYKKMLQLIDHML